MAIKICIGGNMSLLPIKSFKEAGYDSFQNYISDLLDDYEEDLSKSLSEFNFLDMLKKLKSVSKMLKESINLMVDGMHGKSYMVFCELMKELEEDFNILYREGSALSNDKDAVKKLGSIDYSDLITTNFTEFFRCRRNTKNEEFSSMDLFHRSSKNSCQIPNFRYSINGFPCLYLGSTINCCLKEIESDYQENIWASKFKLKKDIKYLDLTMNPSEIVFLIDVLKRHKSKMIELSNSNFSKWIKMLDRYSNNDIVSSKEIEFEICKGYDVIKMAILENSNSSIELRYKVFEHVFHYFGKPFKDNILELNKTMIENLRTIDKTHETLKNYFYHIIPIYPLQIVSSVKKSESGYSIPEYIIPQHLMEWVRDNLDFDGIKYISTKLESGEIKDEYINYAFPVRRLSEHTGYCDYLLEVFEIEEPFQVKSF